VSAAVGNSVEILANTVDGLAVTSPTGVRLALAAVDEGGNIHAIGGGLTAALIAAVIEMQHNFWAGQGHLTVVRKCEVVS